MAGRGKSPKEFAKAMDQLSKNIKDNSVIAVKKAALTVDQNVVASTPVDTGRARANWIVTRLRPSVDVKKKPNSPADGANSALAQGRSKVEEYKIGDNGIFITNNLPYIKRLNDGYSAQVAENFVERAIQAGRKFIKSVELLKKPKGI